MKNIILISFLLFSTLNADYLYTKKNICVTDLHPYENHSGWCYTSSSTNYCDTKSELSEFIDGYNIVNGSCMLKNDLKITGLSQTDYDYFLALIANLLGFTMLFLISFLAVLVSRR